MLGAVLSPFHRLTPVIVPLPLGEGVDAIFTLQMRKLRLRDVKKLAQGHTAEKQQSQKQDPREILSCTVRVGERGP